MLDNQHVVLDHGTGAKLSQDIIAFITDILGPAHIGEMEDSAILPINGSKIAMTTDSYVVTPHIFGNGNIGKIAVCGTVNDIAVSGAKPLYITLAMILEVGLSFSELRTIVESIRDTALEAGVKVVAGDTKVVNKGEADKIFINTTGVGVLEREEQHSKRVRPGDKIILSGFLGNHSIHLLSLREGLGFESRILSDCAPLNQVIDTLLTSPFSNDVHCIRDVTRGGFAELLQAFTASTGYELEVSEQALPIQAETAMAADMLGVEPIHLANEGCICLFVKPDSEQQVVQFLREFDYCREAVSVGTVLEVEGRRVTLLKEDGTKVALSQLEGAELPRLC
ncbi:hydrogenase expression/formation protein HypE [Photobacterium sp. GJ3]|uniref:hydrogenase expression/formation protein HypE n=1 Tax=Photobacterium sp. GJ3 TaxID=2829502 RepID=UPI001B8B5937|nr:hydrogenase expression/formation protein HypE [Photobacterium sp. GJ3]QUJ66591.1 hydrogenase expression/formation protein HypE [Photobacterium sp. GJ3]